MRTRRSRVHGHRAPLRPGSFTNLHRPESPLISILAFMLFAVCRPIHGFLFMVEEKKSDLGGLLGRRLGTGVTRLVAEEGLW